MVRKTWIDLLPEDDKEVAWTLMGTDMRQAKGPYGTDVQTLVLNM